MLLHATDPIPFGKYYGIQIGLIYLLSPDYLNWMLSTTEVCIGDIEFLKSLKVINRFGDQGYVAHAVGVDTDEFRKLWSDTIDFEDVKFSGYNSFSFSKSALDNNSRKLAAYTNSIEFREIIPEEERDILIYYPGTSKKSDQTSFIPLTASTNKTERTVLSFQVDNTSGKINFLPFLKNLKVSSFFWSEWGISPELMEEHFVEKRPLTGQILEGRLMLKS